jgi:hypothetical protein
LIQLVRSSGYKDPHPQPFSPRKKRSGRREQIELFLSFGEITLSRALFRKKKLLPHRKFKHSLRFVCYSYYEKKKNPEDITVIYWVAITATTVNTKTKPCWRTAQRTMQRMMTSEACI